MTQGETASPYTTARGISATMAARAVTDTQTGYAPDEPSADTSGTSASDTGSPVGDSVPARPGVPAGASTASTAENRWYIFTATSAVAVDTQVAKSVVTRIPAGSCEPAATRSPITPVGSNVTDEVFMAKNSAIALLAVPLTGFSLSSSCIARMPNGVAALARPRALADRLRIMAPIAG